MFQTTIALVVAFVVPSIALAQSNGPVDSRVTTRAATAPRGAIDVTLGPDHRPAVQVLEGSLVAWGVASAS